MTGRKFTLLILITFGILTTDMRTAYANLYFPHICTTLPWQTEIAIINTGDETVTGTLEAFSNHGQLVETKPVTLSARSRRQITIADEFIYHADIGYIILNTDFLVVQGYTKFYQEGIYRSAIPAVNEVSTSDIYIPHIASNADWWTGVSLVNTTSETKELTMTFSDGQTKNRTLTANQHDAFSIRELFDNQPQPDIESAVISNAGGIIGLELFGSSGWGTQLDGILLTDKVASTIYYPHVDNNGWWTGIVAYNPSESACSIIVTPYNVQGTSLATTTLTLAGKEKYVGTVSTLGLPDGTEWFRIDSTNCPLSGFELFGTVDGGQLAAYAGGGDTGTKAGIFAKIEKNGWTGIAFVNTEAETASVSLTAYDDNGNAIAASTLSVGGHTKVVGLTEVIFSQDISSATYVVYSSDRNVVGFQLNGSEDWTMLDGLPALEGTATVTTTTTTTLTASSTSIDSGTTVTLIAMVSPSTATGTVTFYDGSTSLGTEILISGVATLTTSSLSEGTHTIKARYGGSNVYLSSSSNSTTVTVNSTVPSIVLNGNSVAVTGSGATTNGNIVTITSAGTYVISGTLADGQIIVNTADTGTVRLVLNGVSITNTTSAPIYIMQGKDTVISLADNKQNYVTDSRSPVASSVEPDAAIFSKSDLTIEGNGSLNVVGNYSDGIASKDSLTINGGTITVNAADDGIRGKDYLIIKNGTITVNAKGDGLKSTNDEDASKGYVSVEGGMINIVSGADAIQAETNVVVTGGQFTLTTGGGSTATLAADASAKGIKANTRITISGGNFNMNCLDDAINATDETNSTGSITINGGTFTIVTKYDAIDANTVAVITGGTFTITTGGGSSYGIAIDTSAKGIKGSTSVTISDGTFTMNCADDDIHSNGSIIISGGTFSLSTNSVTRDTGTTENKGHGINAAISLQIDGATTDIDITKSFEGITSKTITINNGNINIVASDDGVNASDPNSDMLPGYLYINGGYLYVNAEGDGLDSNGSIAMTGGTVIVHGPTNGGNGVADTGDGAGYKFTVNGGTLVAIGPSQDMVINLTASGQNSLRLKFSSAKTAGTLFNIQNSNGTSLLTFKPKKTYQYVYFSSPNLTSGTYKAYYGGSTTGTDTDGDGLYEGGTYSPGTLDKTFTISGTGVFTIVQ
jgi:hypothetical protein